MFMISLFYVIINYELNNELIIYWINGITKLNFANSEGWKFKPNI